ncbi:MAG: methylaspartate mutase subunit E [Clostridiaceae bacterium]
MENKKWTEERLRAERKKVADEFPHFGAADHEEAMKCLRKLPENRSCAFKLGAAVSSGTTLLQSEAGGDILTAAFDRDFSFITAEGLRKMLERIEVPVQGVPQSPHTKIQCEVICASGGTSIAGGGISYNTPYESSISLEESLLDWQYCDRLVGFYNEMGIQINREMSVPPSSILIPPSMSNAVAIIEALMSAEQGVRNITIAQRQYGNLIQDVAAIKALKEQLEEYFSYFGYKDICISTAMRQLNSEFHANGQEAAAAACYGAAAASLAVVNKVHIEASCVDEAKIILNMLFGQSLPMSKEVETEISITKAETKCIINKVLEKGMGDLAAGVMIAFEKGIMDIPAAPAEFCLGQMTSGRDARGAVRYMDSARVPLSDELKGYNVRKLRERDKAERGI